MIPSALRKLKQLVAQEGEKNYSWLQPGDIFFLCDTVTDSYRTSTEEENDGV